ncbi:MAG: isoaspartyl peptidase/L-asparaginase [Chitinophagales bacterium]
MKYLSIFTLFLLIQTTCNHQNTSMLTTAKVETQITENQFVPPITLVIHGGAGTILKEDMSPELENAYTSKLTEALKAGFEILENGGSSIDAVQKVINILEDSPLFNAGKGAVFTNDGHNELDASIMDGKTLNAGAVAGVKTVKNPIDAARKVMENSPHIMMAGNGADIFAKEQGLKLVDSSYFFTQKRWDALQKALKYEKMELDHDSNDNDKKKGTVGAVALDKNGNLAAGTSTGGMTNKRWGRVGDSPIIGAGTYANNQTCAVSSTGHGEFFIRNVVAYDIAALMEYGGKTLQEAADYVVNQKLKEQDARGGVIALDAKGNYAMPFNTEGMYRGVIQEGKEVEVLIYK